MSMYDDMKTRCRECASAPPFGRVVITEAHYASAAGATREAKREDLRQQAWNGCCEGSGYPHASADVEDVVQDGRAVEVMVAQCGDDPNFVPPD